MKTLLISLVVAAVAGVSASYAAPAKKAAAPQPSAVSQPVTSSSDNSASNSDWQLKKSPRAHHRGQYANSISLN